MYIILAYLALWSSRDKTDSQITDLIVNGAKVYQVQHLPIVSTT